MIRDMVIKTLYELMLPESADEKRAYAELIIRELDALLERAEKSEAMVERMIEAGNRLCELAEELDDLVDEFRAYPDLFSWRALVAEWKERK